MNLPIETRRRPKSASKIAHNFFEFRVTPRVHARSAATGWSFRPGELGVQLFSRLHIRIVGFLFSSIGSQEVVHPVMRYTRTPNPFLKTCALQPVSPDRNILHILVLGCLAKINHPIIRSVEIDVVHLEIFARPLAVVQQPCKSTCHIRSRANFHSTVTAVPAPRYSPRPRFPAFRPQPAEFTAQRVIG
jgi:hypothetical protein